MDSDFFSKKLHGMTDNTSSSTGVFPSTSKLSGLLGGLENSNLGWINELAQPGPALAALSTDYGQAFSALDSVAKSVAETTKLSGLLGLENSQRGWLHELARPSSALQALNTDYGRTLSALDPISKSVADTSKMWSQLGLENPRQEWLSEATRPMLALAALSTDFERMYAGLDSVTKSLADTFKFSGLLGLENSLQERFDELTRPSLGLGALSPRESFSHPESPIAENGLVPLLSNLQTYEPIRGKTREQGAFIQVLRGLNPVFPKLWIGAFAALHSSNPDWVRHVAISLRELLTHAMQFMAPDTEMESWINKPEQRSEKGRPTRAARIHFVIAPGIDSLDQKEASELKEILQLFEDLHERTHQLENAVGNFEMNEFISKTEQFISMLAIRHLAKKKLH